MPNSGRPQQSKLPPASVPSFVYPVKSLLFGKIQPAGEQSEYDKSYSTLPRRSSMNDIGGSIFVNPDRSMQQRLRPSVLTSSQWDDRKPIEDDATLASDTAQLTTSASGPNLDEGHSEQSSKDEQTPSATVASARRRRSHSFCSDTHDRGSSGLQKQKKSRTWSPNFRHFPANDETTPRSFSMKLSRNTSSSGRSIENPVYTSLGDPMADPFYSNPNAMQNAPLPLLAGSALAATSTSLLPTPPAAPGLIRSTSEPYFGGAELEREVVAIATPPPILLRNDTIKPEESGVPLERNDDKVAEPVLPFNLSETGIVHLPPRPGSASTSERYSSSRGSELYYSAGSISPSISGSHSGASLCHEKSSPRNKLLRRRELGHRQIESPALSTSGSMNASSEQSRADSLSGTSLSSNEPLVTFQFQHMEDEHGHHVVTGREGQFQSCEDEPIRTPGAVQGYGVLIAVQDVEDDDARLVVRQVSENATELLGLPPNYLFGLPCLTDALPDDQVDVLWGNLSFLLDPGSATNDEKNSPHVFLLSGWGAPGSALPDDLYSRDGRRTWSCWCAVHRTEHPSGQGLIVVELELEKDKLNPLYPMSQDPMFVPPRSFVTSDQRPSKGQSSSGNSSPGCSASTLGSDGSTRVGSVPETAAPSPQPPSSDTSATDSDHHTLGGLEGDEYWTPGPKEILASTTSFSKPIPALERLRRMSRPSAASSSAVALPISDETSPQRQSRRQRGRSGAVGMMDIFAVMAQINDQLDAARDLEIFLKIVVGVIKDLTQFHRIMVYQFDEIWNGQVVAELVDWSKTRDLFMGLHFPASDIPAQARQLYAINKVRLLYDRSQPTARIVCRSKEDLDTPLDMTHSYLRAMSPIHIQYLQNMGVRASMSVSIMSFGRLWGLVTCHSYGDHGMRVSFPVRQMLRLLSQSISKNIERLSYAQRLHTRKLVNTITSEKHPTGYIVSNADDLLGLFDADFGILVIGEGAKILGPNQNGQEILIMAEYLRLKQFGTIQASQAVISDYPDLRLTTGLEVVAGLLYVPLSRAGRDFIAFLRRGQPRHVNWAGKPYKDKKERTLEPRKSFKLWSETIAGRSRAWTDEQLETAGVLSLVYGKFIEVWREKESALETTKLTNLILSNASHEVRTPLNHIINYLEMALNGSLDRETRENLRRSHAASKSLLFTINDLLDLTRLESGNETSFNEPFNLHQAIEEATSVYRREAERRQLEFILEVEDVPKFVVGDSKKMCTVIQNLIANALKYTSEGSITVQCTTYGEPEGLRGENQMVIQIVVADTGCGIEEKKMESIFREFEQVEQEDKTDEAGVGFGLAVVARIVGQLGGQLRVESVSGEGSRFSFLIPLFLVQESDGGEGGGSDRSSKSSSKGSSKGSLQSSARSERSEIENLVEALASNHLISQEHQRPKLARSGSYPQQPGSQIPMFSGLAAENQALPTPTPPAISGQTIGFFGASTRSQPQSEQSKGSLRVLVVEDNDINRFILAKRLNMNGHTVINTTNGQEGVEMVEKDQAFDLVFMDIQMPILDGFEATQRIRQFEKQVAASHPNDAPGRLSTRLNGRIPIFAISASLRESQREELVRYGIDGWILKPVDFKRLNVVIQGVLDPAQRQKDLYHPGCNWESGGWLLPSEVGAAPV